MNSKVGKNYLFNLIYQILIMILPFITTPYVSRVLGAEGVGIYNFSYSVVNVFILVATLGTTSFGIREIAYHQGNRKACTKLFYEITALRVTTTCVMGFMYVGLILKSGTNIDVYIAMLTYLLATPIDISWFFQGLEEFKKTIVRNTVVRLVGIVLVFCFVKSPEDVPLYALIMGGTALVGNLTLWFYLPKYIDKFSILDVKPLRHLKSSLVFFIPAISIYIYTSLDKIILGIFSTEAEVGYYSQSEKIVKLVISVILSLSTVLMPRMAFLIKHGKNDEVKANLNKAYQFVEVLSLPIMVGLGIITSYFVPLFLGSGFDKCVYVMMILIPLVIIMGISNMTGTLVMISMGQQKQYNIIVVVASIINCILNLIVVQELQSVGVALSTVVAEGFVTLSQMYCVRKLIDFRAFIHNFMRYFINSSIMGIVLCIIKIYLPCGWASVVVLVLIGIMIYGMQLFLQKDVMLKIVLDFVKRVLKKQDV